MRTQGILLVRDAILLLAVLPINGETYASNSLSFLLKSNPTALDARLGLWRQSCDEVLASLEDFSQKLFENIKRFREYGDKAGADLISSNCIACLAHLAVLYEVAGRIYPDAGEIFTQCDFALRRLGALTSDLQSDEYTCLDLLLGVRPFLCYFLTVMTKTGNCWDRSLGKNH